MYAVLSFLPLQSLIMPSLQSGCLVRTQCPHLVSYLQHHAAELNLNIA